jgi:hypothetical protein
MKLMIGYDMAKMGLMRSANTVARIERERERERAPSHRPEE